MQYVPWIISVVSILVSLYLASHKEKKEDDTKTLVAITQMNTKQDAVLQNVQEIRVDQRTQGAKIENIEKELVKVQASTDSAHKRLDGFEDRINSYNK